MFTALILCFTFTGCITVSDDDDIWLADLSNPFLGKWEFRPISADGTLVQFDFKTDGTYDCEMPEAMPGFIMHGGYLVSGNKQVSFLSYDDGIGGYEFKVKDNNTIIVTEIDDIDEEGNIVYGNSLPFTRIAGSPVNKENKPFALSNELIGGTWTGLSGATFKFNADGTGVYHAEAFGDVPYVYTAFYDEGLQRNVIVDFTPMMNKFEAMSFTRTDDTHVTFNEIESVSMGAEGLVAEYGEDEPITRSTN
jgi:hypothetical protein